MRLSQHLPGFPSSERAWRKFFTRSRKQTPSNETSEVSAPSSLPEPSSNRATVATPQTYGHAESTPRASSEYASSNGGPPEDDDDMSSLESPVSFNSPWNSSLSDSPASSKRSSLSTPTRPMSIFSGFQRGHFTEDIEEEPTCSSTDGMPTDDQLILTLTSKYPTGAAADTYVPIDVSMPHKPNAAWRLSNRARPSSVLISRPNLISRTSSKNKRSSMHGQLHY